MKKGYCHCGCGEKTNSITKRNDSRGYVIGEYYKHVKGHINRKGDKEYKVDINGCWIWMRAKDIRGYGKGPLGIKAHRYIYERERGEIPKDKELDHLCRNHICVNPDHLEPVYHVENIRRGNATKLSKQKVKQIKDMINKGKLTFVEISKLLKVTPGNISKIHKGITWKDV